MENKSDVPNNDLNNDVVNSGTNNELECNIGSINQDSRKKTKSNWRDSIISEQNNLEGDTFNSHYLPIYEKFKYYPFDCNNWVNILKEVMESVDKEKLPGPVKKDLVLKIILKLLDNLNMSKEDNENLKQSYNKQMSNFIDVIISISKGQTTLNKKKKKILFCC